ncbi:hypothetical protein [Halotalea alkalilenta]|uniref:hypothetical protein n=1 Tax=Halotalea alkalilenta TaxID=376489 RepID=UPI0012DC1915|nr:hypothetical protein [Halotalea alkalilenta]
MSATRDYLIERARRLIEQEENLDRRELEAARQWVLAVHRLYARLGSWLDEISASRLAHSTAAAELTVELSSEEQAVPIEQFRVHAGSLTVTLDPTLFVGEQRVIRAGTEEQALLLVRTATGAWEIASLKTSGRLSSRRDPLDQESFYASLITLLGL